MPNVLKQKTLHAKSGGPKGSKAAWSWAWNKVRTKLGVAAVRSNARIKLDGLRWCGPGSKEAYARRTTRQHAGEVAKATARAMYNAGHDVVHTAASLPPRW